MLLNVQQYKWCLIASHLWPLFSACPEAKVLILPSSLWYISRHQKATLWFGCWKISLTLKFYFSQNQTHFREPGYPLRTTWKYFSRKIKWKHQALGNQTHFIYFILGFLCSFPEVLYYSSFLTLPSGLCKSQFSKAVICLIFKLYLHSEKAWAKLRILVLLVI